MQKQRRPRQDAPITHLIVCHAADANLKHVQVIPPARKSAIDEGCHLVDDGEN